MTINRKTPYNSTYPQGWGGGFSERKMENRKVKEIKINLSKKSALRVAAKRYRQW